MESWLKDIEGARNEAEVVRHARDYCSLMHPRDFASLPTGYRELSIESGADISAAREKLARGYSEARAHASEVQNLRSLISLLTRADERLAELKQR